MKQTLVLGSTVIDVLVSLPHLPARGEDINIRAPLHRLGGCAYNVYETLRFLESPALLCSPVGTGVYGQMVRDFMQVRGIRPLVNLEEENGCCYCLIEDDGERSFLSHHGAEYFFSPRWLKDDDISNSDSVYISGIELEDRDGDKIVRFVREQSSLNLFFAPGPRITRIDPRLMDEIFTRRDTEGKGPFLHLNEKEACSYSGRDKVEDAARFLVEKTGSALVITLGAQGCYCAGPGGSGFYVPGFPVRAVDTTGAGDAHCGAVMAGLLRGKTLAVACEAANRIAAAVTGMYGAALIQDPSNDSLGNEVLKIWDKTNKAAV